MHNRHVKFGQKIPNRLGKIARKLYGDFFDSDCTHRHHHLEIKVAMAVVLLLLS